MVTVSPPVSPNVVARILMIQKPSVTAGTLVRASCLNSRSVIHWLLGHCLRMAGACRCSQQLNRRGQAGFRTSKDEPPAVQLCDGGDEAKTKAVPLGVSCAFHSREAFGHSPTIGSRHAWPIVHNLDANGIPDRYK